MQEENKDTVEDFKYQAYKRQVNLLNFMKNYI